jgi:hypothetical protein
LNKHKKDVRKKSILAGWDGGWNNMSIMRCCTSTVIKKCGNVIIILDIDKILFIWPKKLQFQSFQVKMIKDRKINGWEIHVHFSFPKKKKNYDDLLSSSFRNEEKVH